MVGVGGRSKACGNCYRRRIKCDETRPKCEKCAKSKLDCDGYKPMTFIQYGKGSKQPWKIDQPHENTAHALQRKPKAELQKPSGQTQQEFGALESLLGLELPPAKDDIYVNYTLAYLLSSRTEHMGKEGATRDLSDTSLLALSTFFFGNEHRDIDITQHGIRRYGKALTKVNQALADDAIRKSYDCLEAVIVMAMFEYLMSDRPAGWVAHSLGLEQLLETCGPQTFTEPAERYILERARPSIIFAHLVVRKATILSQAQWKHVPWSLGPSTKSPNQYLVDVMTDCPELTEIEDQMKAARNVLKKKRWAQELYQKANHLIGRLEDWKRGWDRAEPDYRREELSSSSMVQHRRFTYKSLSHANAITLYHGTRILSCFMAQRAIIADSSVTDDEEQPTPDFDQSAYNSAIDIIESADYCIDHARGGLGSFYIMFPLRMAWPVVADRNQDLRKALQAKVHKIQHSAAGHWAIAGYLLSLNMAHSSGPPFWTGLGVATA